MSKEKTTVLAIAFLCILWLLFSPATAMDSDNYGLNWNTMASGGEPVSSTSYALDATIGQPSIGFKSSPDYDLCSGYWCGGKYAIYLPLVLRNFSP